MGSDYFLEAPVGFLAFELTVVRSRRRTAIVVLRVPPVPVPGLGGVEVLPPVGGAPLGAERVAPLVGEAGFVGRVFLPWKTAAFRRGGGKGRRRRSFHNLLLFNSWCYLSGGLTALGGPGPAGPGGGWSRLAVWTGSSPSGSASWRPAAGEEQPHTQVKVFRGRDGTGGGALVHTHTHTQTNTHRHTQKRTRIQTDTHTDTQIHTHTDRDTHRNTHTHTHTHTQKQTDTHTHTHRTTHTGTETHTHRNTHTHTHTHTHTGQINML